MSTEVRVHAAPTELDALAAHAQVLFAEAERRFSRFRTDSELARLNQAAGPTRVSPELFAALARARAYHEATGGLFDPAVGTVLEALGYRRSFAPGALDHGEAVDPSPAGTFLEVQLDARTHTVAKPAHLHLDLGGMLKGRTVDLAVAALGEHAAIDAGGDVAVRGHDPEGEEWLVDVEDPADPTRTVATVALKDAAIATSAPNRRSWRTRGGRAHHLIDPRTRAPATSDLRQVSVVAPTAELADVLAKSAFLLGATAGARLLLRWPAVGAVMVDDDARVRCVGAVDLRGLHA